MPRGRPPKTAQSQPPPDTYWDKLSSEVSSNQSKLSMVLGALIILVVGILVFNYFSRGRPEVGPAQQTEQQMEEDVSPNKLPGKYKVKEGDTLFLIAEKYYQNGSKYEELTKANNLSDPNLIEVGQVLEIPKLAEAPVITPTPSPTETPPATAPPSPDPSPSPDPPSQNDAATPWGPKITGNSYTVVEGDWLSKIAGRAYGDIFAYRKLAQVNNIKNPDLIFPGQVINIPR